jgi:hypothetical protein
MKKWVEKVVKDMHKGTPNFDFIEQLNRVLPIAPLTLTMLWQNLTNDGRRAQYDAYERSQDPKKLGKKARSKTTPTLTELTLLHQKDAERILTALDMQLSRVGAMGRNHYCAISTGSLLRSVLMRANGLTRTGHRAMSNLGFFCSVDMATLWEKAAVAERKRELRALRRNTPQSRNTLFIYCHDNYVLVSATSH